MVGLSLGLSTEFTAVQGYKSLVSHLLHTKLSRNECMNIMQFFTVLHRPIQLQVDINIEIRKTSGQRILTRKCRIAPNGVSAYIRSQRRSSSDHGIDAARALLRYGAGDRETMIERRLLSTGQTNGLMDGHQTVT